MAYEDLDTIVIDFEDFRSGYRFHLFDTKPVNVELDGLTGKQQGDVRPTHELFHDLPPRYIHISAFYDCRYTVSRRESREHLLAESVEANELPEDELEERVTEYHREVLGDWWGDLILETVTLDGHEVAVEWVDGDQPLNRYQYFQNLDLGNMDI